MSDIAEILASDELDVEMMAQLHKLPKSDFIRIFGEHDAIQHKTYLQHVGNITYRFTLENKEPRIYKNHGYAPPIP